MIARQLDSRVLWALIASLVAVPGFAQTGSTTAPFQSLSIERVQTTSNLLATEAATIEPGVLAAITSGALEARQRLVFNADNNTLTSTLFTVAPGSPAVTPLTSPALSNNVLGTFAIAVDRFYSSTTPVPSILIVGRVQSSSNSPFGSLAGLPAAVSVGYTAGAGGATQVATINNAVVVVAGRVVGYSSTAAGTLTVPVAPTTPGGGPTGPTVVIKPVGDAILSQIQLDASGSTDPGGGALTYSWRVVGKSATLINANSATPSVQFSEGFGTYTFEVTVTNAMGVATKGTIAVNYIGL
jgi:hypothetical protein